MSTNSYFTTMPKGTSVRRLIVSGLLIFGATSFAYSQENTLPDNGNVGIGTTSPDAKLTVAGSARIDSSLVVNDSLHVKNTLTVVNDARMGADLKVDGDLILPDLIAPETYPSHLTFLFADDNAIVRKGNYDDVSDVLKNLFYAPPLGSTQPGFNFCTDTYIAHPTWMNGTNKLYVACPDVRIGIGTDSPAYTLDNRGTSKFGGHTWFGTTASVGADNNTFSKFLVSNSTLGTALQVDHTGSNQYSKLIYGTYQEPTTEILKITNTALNYNPLLLTGTGALTIASNHGTTFSLEESGKLTLYSDGVQTFRVETSGFVRARKVRVDLDTWADYVFEPTYKLMPLAEVELFVAAKKHLPNVPSEKELIENGADIMEMNRILMEKVEELTLYLIEQNKKIECLQLEIENINSREGK